MVQPKASFGKLPSRACTFSTSQACSLPREKAGEADALTLATLAAAAEALGWAVDAHRCRWPGSSTQLASDRSNRFQKIRSEFCANSVIMINKKFGNFRLDDFLTFSKRFGECARMFKFTKLVVRVYRNLEIQLISFEEN